MTIGEVSRLTGVTIRTLRHYDRIGLLRPTTKTDAGYRLYDEASLQRLHTILIFRELEYPLEEIRRILDRPGFDMNEALRLQREQLLMRRGHIDRLIALTRTISEKGMKHMDFSAFDERKAADLSAQAEAAYGSTDAWKEFARREKTRSPGDNERNGKALMAMIGQFGRALPLAPDSAEAQAFVQQLRDHITAYFYPCTIPVLHGLADTYETPDFRRNIDREGGDGTAEALAEAIRIYCTRNA